MGLPPGHPLQALPAPWKHLQTSRTISSPEDLSNPQPQLLLPLTPKINLPGWAQLTLTGTELGGQHGALTRTHTWSHLGEPPRGGQAKVLVERGWLSLFRLEEP